MPWHLAIDTTTAAAAAARAHVLGQNREMNKQSERQTLKFPLCTSDADDGSSSMRNANEERRK
jgi:hypothetical protein